VFNVVNGLGQSAGKMLAEHGDINKLVLTGGTEAGRIAGAAAAKVFAHQTMELGGKTPSWCSTISTSTARSIMPRSAPSSVLARPASAPARHLVQASIYDEFVEKLKRKTESIRIGDPFDAATQLGPVISARQRDRVLSYCGFGRDDGARLVAGGYAAKIAGHENGIFVQPRCSPTSRAPCRIFQEEVFGPFTSVTPFKDESDALRLANVPRSASRRRSAPQCRARPSCGVRGQGRHRLDQRPSPARSGLALGGVDDSGVGREFGTESFDDHFNTKSVMVATHDQPFDWYRDTAAQRRLN